MLDIQIKSEELIRRVGQKSGKEYHQQEAWLEHPNGERLKMNLYVGGERQDAENNKYKIGKYTLCPSSFGVERGNLEIGFVRLVPAKA